MTVLRHCSWVRRARALRTSGAWLRWPASPAAAPTLWRRRTSDSPRSRRPRSAGPGRDHWVDVAAIELNEAFAVQSLAWVDAWEVDPEIVNAKGGAIAIGHPFGASGGRILGTLAHRLRESGDRWG